LSCQTAGTAPAPGENGSGGGGAGGSFGGTGGNGGSSQSVDGALSGGIAGPAVLPPTLPRGGCDGQVGALTGPTSVVGKYGRGGGAVYLIAKGSIAIDGIINASGEGAPGALGTASGAGGGGSGGMIGLDAPNIQLNSTLFANGGGGAAANTTMVESGASPGSGSISTPAAGGFPGTNGAIGGAGGARNANNGVAAATITSGPAGGGGGSVGYVFLVGTVGGNTVAISPSPIQQ
jgi:hypothetical protein